MRCLVTGGAGFIGSHICEALLAQGASVCVLDDLSTGSKANLDGLKGDVRFVQGSVLSENDVQAAMEGVTHLAHLAATVSVEQSVEAPARCARVNVEGTARVLQTAQQAGVRHAVLASSAAAYGNDPAIPKHESTEPAPVSPYGASKVAAEQFVAAAARLYAMHAASLRFFNVYGPRQDPTSPYAAVVPRFMAAMAAGQAPTVFGDGGQSRDFCYVSDVADAVVRALQWSQARGHVLNIASGRATTVLELVHCLNATLGTHLRPQHAAARPGDVYASRADISRAAQFLGHAPTVGLDEGLRRTVAACYQKE